MSTSFAIDEDRETLQRRLLAARLIKDARELQQNLSLFIRRSWEIIEPGTEYIHNWHIDLICEYLQAVRDEQITRLIINVPPRSMKSTITTINFPTWWWAGEPSMRFLFASYADSLAKAHSIARRDILLSEWYQARWGEKVRLAEDQNEKREFKNTERGHMIAVPIGGGLTGRGGNCIIIDDPQSPEQADSETERLRAIRYIRKTLLSRLDDKKRGRIIMIMQRVHQKDPTAELLADGNWTHLVLPAEATKKVVIDFPRSHRKVERKIGDLLWPEREGKKELAIMRAGMTEVGYACQYQQQPAPQQGAILKREWWRFYAIKGIKLDAPEINNGDGVIVPAYRDLPLLPTHDYDDCVDSWDCSFKGTDTSDYVCGGKWLRAGSRMFLLAYPYVHKRMGFAETLDHVISMAETAPASGAKLIEDKANGPAIIETVQNRVIGAVAIEPKGSKRARAEAASPVPRAGNIYLPHPLIPGCSWVWSFIEECAAFTGKDGETDDQVDMFTQAVNYFVLQAGGIYDFIKATIEEQELEMQQQRAKERQARQSNQSFIAKEVCPSTQPYGMSGGFYSCALDLGHDADHDDRRGHRWPQKVEKTNDHAPDEEVEFDDSFDEDEYIKAMMKANEQ